MLFDKYLKTITTANQISIGNPVKNDFIYYTILTEVHNENTFRNFSIKFVLEGCENYKIGSEIYKVTQDHFLLANKQPGACFFSSKGLVKGACIDISTDTLSEAFSVMSARDDFNFENYLSSYFEQPHFFENVYNLNQSLIGNSLLQLSSYLLGEKSDIDFLNDEWFLDVAEKIILQEYGNYQALNGLNSVKNTTRKETLRRLNLAKEYINEVFIQNPDIEDIARHCFMSKFHFFRSFRQAYGITPYQYLLQKKLDHARKMIEKKDMPVNEVAVLCNFSNIYNFSRAFKKKFGKSPTKYLKLISESL